MIDREELAIELQSIVAHIRQNLPDAVITTRFAHGDANGVVIHAQIVGGDGQTGGAHATAPAGDGSAEVAENRALQRAMIALGLGPIDSATGPRLHPVRDSSEANSRVVQFPKQEPDRATPEAPSEPQPQPSAPLSDAPEEISWTAFWRWARSAGYADKTAVETAIGRPISDLTPGQIRVLLDK
jgi:hypothetical protein